MQGNCIKYFIEVEKRYRTIIELPQNIFNVMHLALIAIVPDISKEQGYKI